MVRATGVKYRHPSTYITKVKTIKGAASPPVNPASTTVKSLHFKGEILDPSSTLCYKSCLLIDEHPAIQP